MGAAAFGDLADFCAAASGVRRSSGACPALAPEAATKAGNSARASNCERLTTKSGPSRLSFGGRIGSRRGGDLEHTTSRRRPGFPQALRSLYGRAATFARRSDAADSRLERRAEALDNRVHLS